MLMKNMLASKRPMDLLTITSLLDMCHFNLMTIFKKMELDLIKLFSSNQRLVSPMMNITIDDIYLTPEANTTLTFRV